jgi:hypothetical protein
MLAVANPARCGQRKHRFVHAMGSPAPRSNPASLLRVPQNGWSVCHLFRKSRELGIECLLDPLGISGRQRVLCR